MQNDLTKDNLARWLDQDGGRIQRSMDQVSFFQKGEAADNLRDC